MHSNIFFSQDFAWCTATDASFFIKIGRWNGAPPLRFIDVFDAFTFHCWEAITVRYGVAAMGDVFRVNERVWETLERLGTRDWSMFVEYKHVHDLSIRYYFASETDHMIAKMAL
jgi:hypothetical protein